MRALFMALLALATGCGAKAACDGESTYSCIDATVKGSVHDLDQLRITVTGLAATVPDTQLSPTTAKKFSLPAELAIELPSTAAGTTVHVLVEGLSSGNVVAAASWSGTAPPAGKPVDATFELGSSTGDGGSDVVSLAPSPLAFGPTGVGKTATADVMVTNGTASKVTLGAATLTGATDFTFGAAATTDAMACAGSSGGLVVPAQTSCHVVVSFTPAKVGSVQGTFTIPYGGASSLSLDVSGVGIAIAFVDETLSTKVNFVAVSGAASAIYAVGSSPNDCVAIWGGAAWASNCNGIADTNLHSVFALDATDVWVGGLASNDGIAFSSNGTSWTPGMLDASVVVPGASIVGIYAVSATQVYAVESSEPGHVLSSGNGMNWLEDATPLTGSIATLASNGTTLMVAGEDGQVAFNMNTNGAFAPSAVPTGVSSSITIPSAWGAPGGAYYFVSQTADPTAPKWAVFSISAGTTAATALYELADAGLYLNAISGRATAGGGVELYAVGGLNSQILHGTSANGSFSWTLDPLPLGDPLNAVWVGPTGEVVAVGGMGIIEHLH